MGKIVKLTPYIVEKVWGGKKLSKIKNIESINPIGETWEVATLNEGSSKLDSINLKELCELSYVVKFIDTSQNLSIQVHPDEEYANKFENTKGKTECWYILDNQENAGIYLGLKSGITKKEFFTGVNNGLAIDQFLNFIPVQKGDFFIIPAGAIHAIGNDVTLCEVQQASGVTYRVWDWNRVGMDGKPRELHIEKAKDVANFNKDFNEELLNCTNFESESGIIELIKHADFNVQMFSKISNKDLEINLKNKDSIIILEGNIAGDIQLNAFDSAIVMEEGLFQFQIEDQTSFLVVSE